MVRKPQAEPKSPVTIPEHLSYLGPFSPSSSISTDPAASSTDSLTQHRVRLRAMQHTIIRQEAEDMLTPSLSAGHCVPHTRHSKPHRSLTQPPCDASSHHTKHGSVCPSCVKLCEGHLIQTPSIARVTSRIPQQLGQRWSGIVDRTFPRSNQFATLRYSGVVATTLLASNLIMCFSASFSVDLSSVVGRTAQKQRCNL